MSSQIKCACGASDCLVRIIIDDHMWITDKDGKETLIYLDANTIVKMINALRASLIKRTNIDLSNITEQ